MEIHEEKKGAVVVIKPVGPLTHDVVEPFAERLMTVRAASMGRLVVDATAVPYVDSKGLEALVEANEQLNHAGQTLKLCGINETLREVLSLTELTNLFEHYEDVGAAVRSFL